MSRILIIAGEASGDRHAADLVRALKHRHPGLQFVGIGGDQMKRAGVELRFHISQLAFLGFSEIVRHLPFIFKVQRTLQALLQETSPQAVILVDYPGFNLRVARMAHNQNVPVVYYICPQLWAWGERRVKKMRQFVDLPLVIFDFEVDFFARHGITAHFVGHPLVDQIRVSEDEATFRKKYDLPSRPPILGLFPGSRVMEIRKLLPVMFASLDLWHKKSGRKVTPAVAMADHVPPEVYQQLAANRRDVVLIPSDTHSLMHYSKLALVASGTATLELGYLQTPMIVMYAVSPLTYLIGRRLVRINQIALANIVLGENVVPELIQHRVTPENVVALLDMYFSDSTYYARVKEKLGGIKKKLGPPGASERAANKILEFLNPAR